MSSFMIWMIFLNTSFWFACCFGIAFLVRLIPVSAYQKLHWFFKEQSFERRFYKKINIHKWKDVLPEWGSVWNFKKSHLKKELTVHYLEQFIMETYYAEIGHLGMAIFGFCSILVNPNEYAFMALVLSVINVMIQIPFCIIQRYNRPRLLRLKSRMIAKLPNQSK